MQPVAEGRIFIIKVMTKMLRSPGQASLGIASGIVANGLLGVSSLYWKLLGAIDPIALVAIRIVSSLALLLLLRGILWRSTNLLKRWRSRDVIVHAAASSLVVVNWGTFIWASINGHVIESGLGYLLAPFVAIVSGWVLLGERATPIQIGGVLIISGTFLLLGANANDLIHWVYLAIGLTWGGYACLKKVTRLDPFDGLLVETCFLAGLLPVGLLIVPMDVHLPEGLSVLIIVLAGASGFVSLVPLWLFSRATLALPLSVMGFFQFVLPMTQILVATTIYGQIPSAGETAGLCTIVATLLAIVNDQCKRVSPR